MLSVVLQILSILGILLLCLLGLAVLLILLVLFFPVCYRVSGKKNPEDMSVSARAWWLFGLLRVSFVYPEPGRLLIKVLPFTVFDSGKIAGDKEKKTSDGGDGRAGNKEKAEKNQKETGKAQATADSGEMPDSKETPGDTNDVGQKPDETAAQEAPRESSSETAEDSTEKQADDDSSFLKKIKKIKYTIRSIYDKIKNIWENISYYIDLLREEETKMLFSHVIFRLGKILKSIRPRRIRGQVLFGTGSPDTTGYAYGVYGMLSPYLGKRLLVTPDFTRAVLEGDIYVFGHITFFTILWNGLRVLLDKKFRRFIRKMKAGRKR